MKLAYVLAAAVTFSFSAPAQLELYFPDNLPAVGTCNVFPFGSTNFTYVSRLLPTMLDPVNRKIDALAFAPCGSGTFAASNMQLGIGHLSPAAVVGAPISFPTFDAAGNLTGLGVFADYTSLWNTSQNGSMSFPYVQDNWSTIPQATPNPFVWNGTDPVGVFVMHAGATGTSAFHRTSTEPYRWYTSGVFAAPTSTGLGNNGLKVRVTCSPHQALPTVTSVGVGCPGLNAMIPVLSTTELPALGNVAFNVTINNGPAGTTMLLYGSIGLSPAPIPLGGGCNIYLDIVTLDILVNAAIFPIGPIISDPFGVGGFALPIPGDPGLANTHVALQGIVFDGNAPLGVTLTNALELVLL